MPPVSSCFGLNAVGDSTREQSQLPENGRFRMLTRGCPASLPEGAETNEDEGDTSLSSHSCTLKSAPEQAAAFWSSVFAHLAADWSGVFAQLAADWSGVFAQLAADWFGVLPRLHGARYDVFRPQAATWPGSVLVPEATAIAIPTLPTHAACGMGPLTAGVLPLKVHRFDVWGTLLGFPFSTAVKELV